MPHTLPVKARLIVNKIDDQSFDGWAAIAVHKRSERKSYALTKFLDIFEEVEFDKANTERIFQLLAPERLNYRFFQSKNVYHVLARGTTNSHKEWQSNTRKAVELLFMPSVFSEEEGDFYFSFPAEDKPELPMDEFLAGYLIFFYLGSLVRYHPDYLERILRSKEAWIIQRFVTSCSTTLLRRASIFLLGQNRVFASR